ncbi:hypothetical protein SCHPADRAFT_995919 [Schizopora paradoxa]|uniref:F-box domain-containing protein n=1 Tax=Schizopora paradoxa TaxID=27342 RepID=A0A0H2S0K4_9AGAM|nr:hypothetical protein SCHPADRAFT_995919 [Schizopora paradoxa]
MQPKTMTNDDGDDENRGDVLAAVSNWLDHGVATPEDLRREMDAIKSVTSVDMQESSALRTHVHSISRRLRYLSTTLNGLAKSTQEVYEAFGVVSQKAGLALLPDEVLVMVFEFVVAYAKKNEYRVSRAWKAAVRLSHVNQHFRSVLLDCPRFWTNMNSCGEMITACLPRTNGLPLAVDVTVRCDTHLRDCSYEPVLADLLPLSRQWGRLDISFHHSYGDYQWKLSDPALQALHHLDAPLLKELSIFYAPFDDDHNPPFDWSGWNCPNLSSIKIIAFFPLGLPALSNVSSLDLTLRLEDEMLPDILEEISGLHKLEELLVTFTNSRLGNDLVLMERFEFPQIRRLKIATETHFRFDDTSSGAKRSVFSSLFFPNVVHLEIEITGGDYTVLYEEPDDIEHTQDFYFNKELNRIFRHFNQFPRVETFHLDIYSPFGDHHDPSHSPSRCSELSIPLNMLPKVRDFVFRSNTCFEIKEPDDPEEMYFADESAIPLRVVGDAFPTLRTVTLDVLDTSAIAEWLEGYLMRLKDRGEWDGFHELIVVWDRNSGLRKASFAGEKALEWCNSNRTPDSDSAQR